MACFACAIIWGAAYDRRNPRGSRRTLYALGLLSGEDASTLRSASLKQSGAARPRSRSPGDAAARLAHLAPPKKFARPAFSDELLAAIRGAEAAAAEPAVDSHALASLGHRGGVRHFGRAARFRDRQRLGRRRRRVAQQGRSRSAGDRGVATSKTSFWKLRIATLSGAARQRRATAPDQSPGTAKNSAASSRCKSCRRPARRKITSFG